MEHMTMDAATGATLHAEAAAPENAEHLTIGISGMTCDMCAATVAKALMTVDGVYAVKVFKDEAKAMLNAAPGISLDALKAAVAETKDYAVTGVL